MSLDNIALFYLMLSFFAPIIDGFTQSRIKQSLDKLLLNKVLMAFSGDVLVTQNGKIIYKKLFAQLSSEIKRLRNCLLVAQSYFWNCELRKTFG